VAGTDRREMLEGADFVVVAIAVGGPAYNGVPYYHEIEIPARYGVSQQIGDTLGPGGVFRTLRTAPVMLDICRDVEELCPGALMLNYTNPMAMLCWAMTQATDVPVVGLCHSVQGTQWQLANYIGVPVEDTLAWVAGINHMSWFLEFTRKSGNPACREDLYPALRAAAEDPDTYAKDTVRFEMMKHFDYFVTESTPHNSEYLPWFRKRPELIEHFGLNHRTPDREATQAKRSWQEESPGGATVDKDAVKLERSGEYASSIIHSMTTDTRYRFNGNVPNTGLIENLPEGCCVEVPCLTDATGVHPCGIGALPAQLAALNASNVVVQQLTVEAVLERNMEKARMAVALDPLTAAVCSLAECRDMFNELLEADRPWLSALLDG
jgi:alpha-galactosidase